MTLAPDFAELCPRAQPGAELLAAAEAGAAQIAAEDLAGDLVVVARTLDGSYRTVGGSHVVGPVRAAVAAAVASGNTRLWDGVTGIDTTEKSVRSLPEIIRATAESSGLTTVHVGCVDDGTPAAVAVWFEIDGRVAGPARRREYMEVLSIAALRQSEELERRAAEAAALAPHVDDDLMAGGTRRFDPSDPSLDAVTGVATQSVFDGMIEDFAADEAAIIGIAIDGWASLAAAHDPTTLDDVARGIADRLVATCEPKDVIARLDDDRFVVMPRDASRATSLQLAKRLLGTFVLPPDVDGGPDVVTATVAIAHQEGLVDAEELIETVDDGISSGQRAGGQRLVVAG